MHLKSLKVFCDVVGQRSFSRAADKNGITQSGASQVVLHLEEKLGVKLIDRSKRPWLLTPEGEVYYQGARKFIRQYYALEDQVRNFHNTVEGRVRVSSIYSVGLTYMNEFVGKFHADHPKADVQIQYHHPSQVYEHVENDVVDLGLVSYPKGSRTLESVVWLEEPMAVVCANDHPWADRESITIEELDGAQLIGFDRDLRIRREVDRTLSRADVTCDVVLEFDNIETIKRAIEIESGVGLLPQPTVQRDIELGALSLIPLEQSSEEEKPFVRPLGVILRRGKQLGVAAERFLASLKTWNPVMVAQGDNGSPAQQVTT